MPTLSEAASKQLLRTFDVPFASEHDVLSADAAVAAAHDIDPTEQGVAIKLCGEAIAHKTERGLVKLNLRGEVAVRAAATELLAAARLDDGPVSLLIAPMLSGVREFIAGVVNDTQFGPVVMLGVGGVLAEALGDVVFRLLPVSPVDVYDMIDDLATQTLLGEFRGEPQVDRDALVKVIMGLSNAVSAHPNLLSIDLNPLIIVNGCPIAVDALVEVGQ